MIIRDAPPDPTYYRIVLTDPEGSDSTDLTRLLEGQPRGICLQRVGVRKGVAKVSWNPGQFRAVLVVIETVGGGSDGTRFKQRTGGKPGVQCWAFSQSKKEILA